MNKKKLKIGLLLNSYLISAWSYKMIEELMNSNYAQIELILFNDKAVYDVTSSSLVEKALNFIYSKVIERNTYVRNAYELVDSSLLLKAISKIKFTTELTNSKTSINNVDFVEIQNHELDVIIHTGTQSLYSSVLSLAKFGVWSYQCDEIFEDRLSPIGYWESLEGWPVTKSILTILSKDGKEDKQIYCSFSCTDTMSVQDNKSIVAWKSLAFLPRTLKELYRLGDTAFFERIALKHKSVPAVNNSYEKPSDAKLVKIILRKIWEKITLIIKNKIYFDQWILMYDIDGSDSTKLQDFKKIIPPKDRFWADPHIIAENNKYYIFFEELLYKKNIGHISLIIMDYDGNYSEPEIILKKPYHLSYPYVFEHEGSYYMIPETMDNNTIELYECIEFPNKWEFKMNLMENVKAVDATTLYYHGRWWLFVNMVETEGSSSWDELFLFSSDKLFSTKWIAHPMNPIVSDCQKSRPAGKLFEKDGKLYRPSQNCSTRYGYGYNINEVKVLDELSYSEEIVKKVVPDWEPTIIAAHTYSSEQSLKIIDAQYRRRL